MPKHPFSTIVIVSALGCILSRGATSATKREKEASIPHGAAMASLAWFSAAQALGASQEPGAELFEALLNHIRVIQRADPRSYEPLYYTTVVFLSYRAPGPYRHEILDRIRGSFPERWESNFLYGWNALFLESRPQEAAQAWRLAAVQPDAPRFLASSAARLVATYSTNLDSGIDRLKAMLREVPPGAIRTLVEERLAIEMSESILLDYDRACREYMQTHQESPPSAGELFIVGLAHYLPLDLLDDRIYLDENCRARTSTRRVRRDEFKKWAEGVRKNGVTFEDAANVMEQSQ